MNISFTSVAISQLKCLDYAFFVAKMSKMTFTRFGGQVWLNGGQVRQFWGRVGLYLNFPPFIVEKVKNGRSLSELLVKVAGSVLGL